MEKLKPCPFCGGAALIQQHDKLGYSAYCNNYSWCFVLPSTWWTDNEEDAVEMWNRRANDD